MPCSDGAGPLYDRSEAKELHDRNDKLAQMLCGICTIIDDYHTNNKLKTYIILNVPGIAKWWIKHKKQDACRLAMEQEKQVQENIRKSALAKLSNEERRVLGLKN